MAFVQRSRCFGPITGWLRILSKICNQASSNSANFVPTIPKKPEAPSITIFPRFLPKVRTLILRDIESARLSMRQPSGAGSTGWRYSLFFSRELDFTLTADFY